MIPLLLFRITGTEPVPVVFDYADLLPVSDEPVYLPQDGTGVYLPMGTNP